MKKITLTLSIIAFFSIVTHAQKTTKKAIKSDIRSITVYLDGAEINRTEDINLKEGRNEITFTSLSPKLDSRSIRVTTDPDISVLSISSKIDYLIKEEEKPRIRQLKDSVDLIKDRLIELNNDKDAYTIEKEMLLKNQEIGSKQSGVSITELTQAADFFRKRIKEINHNISKIEKEINLHNKTNTKLRSELSELNAENTYQRGEVTILLESETSKTTPIELKYLVVDAGWAPSYDLRAKSAKDPVELNYRAKVFNNTNIDWKEVKLKLSTADPTQSATQPNLRPWYLNYNAYSYSNSIVSKKNEGYMQNMLVTENQSKSLFQDNEKGKAAQYAEVEVAALSAEFEISKNYSIPSDDKPYLVDVNESKLDASYQHFSVAKMDRDAFLIAQITGWEDLNLITGPVNIYFDGTYVGQSYINTRNISDTLGISLGRDKKILVTRTKSKDFSSTKLIGSKRKETFAYEIVVKNNSKAPITIEVEDQIPISQDSEIEVDVIEISDADHNLTTGKLTWKLNLNPGESKKLKLQFAIKYPKNKQVQTKYKPTSKQRMRMF